MQKYELGLRVTFLLFADDVALMAPLVCDLQLDQFTAECEAAGMRISTSKSEATVNNRKPMECLLQVGNGVLSSCEEVLVSRGLVYE